MAGSFDIFRKYQRSLLVFVAIVAMLAFFVLPPILQMGVGPAAGNPVAVAWKDGALRENDLERAVAMRTIVNRFLAESGMAAGRDPSQLPLFPDSEEQVVRAMLLAKEASANGIVVSDAAINDFLSQWTNNLVRPEQFREIIAGLRLGPVAVSQRDLFDAIRTELAARNMFVLFQTGFSGDPPGWRWDAFRRLEQQATIEAVPVVVESLADEVPAPSGDELRTFFEKYKGDLARARSDEPGFREPHRAKFQYLVARRDAALDKAKQEITDEQIADFYEKNKETMFRAKESKDDEKKSDEKKDDAAGADDKKKVDEADKPDGKAAEVKTDDAPKFEPLEKVKDQIRDRLATEQADRSIDAVFTAVASDLTGYSEDIALWQARQEKGPAPRAPDLEKIAAAQGLEAGESDLVTAEQAIASGGVGQSFEFVSDPTSRFGFRQRNWLEQIYGPSAASLRPVTSRDIAGNRYLSWKVEDQPEFTPSFEAARPQVEQAWKIVQGRGIARKKAEAIAAETAGKPSLKDAIAGREGVEVVTVGPFSWLTQGTVPQGTPPSLSDPPGLVMAGEDLMRAVFAIEPGQTTVAFNEPKTICYAIRMESLTPPVADLRETFVAQKDDQRRIAMVAQGEFSEAFGRWFDDLETKHGLQWKRQPRRGNR
ncbi:MAG: hypothetical protein ACKOYJ_09460 [Planctomycetia bacterium]